MTGTTGQGMVVPMWLFVIWWTVRTVLCEDEVLYDPCPDGAGPFYSTSADCLIYYECGNNKVWTKVCFPWQRFDVHQLKCRDFTEVDCNPEYTGIWRRTYDQWSGDGGYTIGETNTESEMENQTNTQEIGIGKGEVVGNESRVDNMTEETTPMESAQAAGEENTFTILNLIKNLGSPQNLLIEKKFHLLKIEEIKEYNVLLEEDKFLPGKDRIVKRFVPDDSPLTSGGMMVTGSEGKDEPQNKFKNVLLMNVDDQSLNSILNLLASNQMMNVNNRDTEGPTTSTIGETLAFDMNCARPINIEPQNMNNNGEQTNFESTSTPLMENFTPSLNPSSPSDAEDSNGGFWYWCGSGRFVYTQSNEQGDSLCEQLQDPEFINQEGSSPQGADWSGHTFIG